jgi:hypothetical protein
MYASNPSIVGVEINLAERKLNIEVAAMYYITNR